jgi:hypothetical protein
MLIVEAVREPPLNDLQNFRSYFPVLSLSRHLRARSGFPFAPLPKISRDKFDWLRIVGIRIVTVLNRKNAACSR